MDSFPLATFDLLKRVAWSSRRAYGPEPDMRTEREAGSGKVIIQSRWVAAISSASMKSNNLASS